MQIQLKQMEIVAALKQYITQKGIALTGKEVIITFTAGRKEAGITADLAIDDFDIPGFSEAEKEPTSLTLVQSAVAESLTTDAMPEPVAALEPVLGTITKSVSLFN